jgi:hypothetical protein
MIGRGSTAPTVPLPLVVYRDVAYCDTRHEHQITLTTDGRTAYAHGDLTTAGTVTRYDAVLTVVCGQPGAEDHACEGVAEFLLDTPGTWTADPTARRELAQHGSEIER